MTTPLHMVSYGLAAYPFVKKMNRYVKWIIIAISSFIGGIPDLWRVFFHEGWNGSYQSLHRIIPQNFIFFLHTVPDYFVHDHAKGGWNVWAWIIEFLFWSVLLFVYITSAPEVLQICKALRITRNKTAAAR